MRETIKRILIIEPSVIVAEGLRHIVDNLAEYTVTGILQDLGEDMETTLDDYDADLLVVDPAIFDTRTRSGGKDLIKKLDQCPRNRAHHERHGRELHLRL